MLSGALCSATVCAAAHQPVAIGAIISAIGAITGALAGYHGRRHLTMNRRAADLPVALVEDTVAVASAVLAVARI